MSPRNKSSKLQNNQYLNLAMVWFFMAIFFILGYLMGGGITGFVVYQQTEFTKEWDFINAEEYIYNDSLIDLNNGARLVSKTEIITIEDYSYENNYITQAIYNSEDKTSQISSIGSGHINTDKDEALNVIFENELNNSDIISMYIKKSNENDIYLCDYNTSCNNPGYGLTRYEGNEGWYNITISGLEDLTDRFNIDPDYVKFDYIYAYRITNNSYTIENITYSDSATIDTLDFTVEDFYSWDTLTVDGSLNNQNINYHYSVDRGESWNLITNFNLSFVNSSTIRLRAELISNRTNTPVLNSMTLRYLTYVACEGNWECTDWMPEECPENETQTRRCTDSNECGSEDNKPETTRSCEYSHDNNPPTILDILVKPNKGSVGIIVNISANIEDENNIGFAEAIILDPNNIIKKLSLYNDNNIYRATWNTTNTTKGTYIIGINISDVNNNNAYYKQLAAIALHRSALGSFTDSSASLIKNQTTTINATETTNALIEISSKNNLNISISTALYYENLKNITPAKSELGKYLDVIVDDTINNNITKGKIVIYYNDSEVSNANIIEDTLRVYYYNETIENWQILNSSVNTTANYVWVELSHFSIYGVFGEQRTTQPSSSGGGGGYGRRRDSSNVQTISTNKEEAKVEEIVKQSETAEERPIPCHYSLNIDLPHKISFAERDIVRGFIKNDGNCDIDEVDLYLNKELVDLAFFENPTIDKIDIGETKEIYLKVKKPIIEKTKIFGFAVKHVEKVIKGYSGELIGEGITNNTIVTQKKIALNVDVLLPSEEVTLNPFLFLALTLMGLIMVIFKRRIKFREKPLTRK